MQILQLVKQNSPEGCKEKSIDIACTPCENLKKTPNMEKGQIGFHNKSQVRLYRNIEKDITILNEVYETISEHDPDLPMQRQQRDNAVAIEKKNYYHEYKANKKVLKKQYAGIRKEWDEAVDYFMPDSNTRTNKYQNEEDFM